MRTVAGGRVAVRVLYVYTCSGYAITITTRSFCPTSGCFAVQRTYCMQVLQAFQKDASVKVLLISLKAGGVALNLTVANHIFLMDP